MDDEREMIDGLVAERDLAVACCVAAEEERDTLKAEADQWFDRAHATHVAEARAVAAEERAERAEKALKRAVRKAAAFKGWRGREVVDARTNYLARIESLEAELEQARAALACVPLREDE